VGLSLEEPADIGIEERPMTRRPMASRMSWTFMPARHPRPSRALPPVVLAVEAGKELTQNLPV